MPISLCPQDHPHHSCTAYHGGGGPSSPENAVWKPRMFIQIFMNFYILVPDYEDVISQWSQDEADYSGVDDSVGISSSTRSGMHPVQCISHRACPRPITHHGHFSARILRSGGGAYVQSRPNIPLLGETMQKWIDERIPTASRRGKHNVIRWGFTSTRATSGSKNHGMFKTL